MAKNPIVPNQTDQTPNNVPPTDFASVLKRVMDDVAAKRDTFIVAMKTGDMNAARSANSADNDFKNLERIQKRYAQGAYK